ncbi:MAG: DUF4175 family protein [Pseudomonadota bacterium]
MTIIPPYPKLDQQLQFARQIMTWERIWPRLVPGLAVVAMVVGLALAGFFDLLPPSVHIVALSVFVVAGLVAITLPWRGFKRPTRQDVLARIERDNHLHHTPLQSLDDDIPGNDDALTSWLWQRQLRLNIATLARLRLPRPRPVISRHDRFGLTVIPVLLLFIGIMAGHDHIGERLYKAFTPLQRLGMQNFSASLWITPPTYTGQVPRVVQMTDNPQTGSNNDGSLPADEGSPPISLDVPAGSVLAGNISSIWTPTLTAPDGVRPIVESGRDTFAINTPLDQDGAWTIAVWGTDRFALNVRIIADKPPVLAFTAPPGTTRRDHIRLDFTAQDDYGLSQLELHASPMTENGDTSAFGSIEDIVVDLRQTRNASDIPTRMEGPHFLDLVSHPWAGLPVRLELVARDNAGQIARSEAISIQLPERDFNHPVARKLITIRQILLRHPERSREMRNALIPVINAPQAFNGDIGVFLALSVAESRLSNHPDNLEMHQQVAGLLWHIAEEIERGSLGIAERNLIEAEERLLDALSNPDITETQLSDLIENYRKALQEYLAALAQDPARQQQQQPARGPETVIEQQDLARVVDQIDALMRAGARDQARALIDRLRELVENMRITTGGQQGGDITSVLRDMIDNLRDMSRRQQELMNSANNPQMAPNGQDRARAQQQLADEADILGNDAQFEQYGNIGNLRDAITAMENAASALDRNRQHDALQQQQQALESLQQGMNELARALDGLSQMAPMLDDLMPGGQRDPLGRPVGGSGETTIPEADDLERAWRIMQELRRRSGDPDRPQIEHDYIDRLLKRF